MAERRPIRVLIAKPGLDGHDKGAKIVAKGLKDAGMEVIYTGIRQTSDAILKTAIQEKLKKENLRDVLVLVGGIIPKKDVIRLKEMGVAKVFRPSSTLNDISQFIKSRVSK
jgi:methylmalonyl-CoA mutase C-terminal domain/subunit